MTSSSSSKRHAATRAALLFALASLAGCGPDYNAINNRLRATTLQQEREIGDLKTQLANREATIRELRAQRSGPPIQTLPQDRLDQLFIPAKLEIRSTSDASDEGDGKGTAGFRIFIRMYDRDGQVIPAAGTMTIEALELPPAPAEPRRIGTWTFSPEQMKKNWFSGFGTNHFAFNCPWQSPPAASDVVFRAHFLDALTGNVLEAQLSKKLRLLPARAPATRPASRP